MGCGSSQCMQCNKETPVIAAQHSVVDVARSSSSSSSSLSEDPRQSGQRRPFHGRPACMEPVFTVAHDYVPPVVPPAPQPHQPGYMEEGRGRRCWRWRWRRGVSRSAVVALLVFLAVTAAFALAVYRARRSPRDLAFVIVAYYLLALLAGCVAKLEQLRRRDNAPDAAVVVAERRRVRIAVWAVSVALGNTFASRVADAVPGLALKLAVWGVTAVVLGIALYFLFFSKDAERCGAELGRGHADAGHRQATASHGVSSPEERV